MSQVIPPGQTAGFDITFSSPRVQNYKGSVTYIINEIHFFKFMVLANSEPVVLDVQRVLLRFAFPDDSMDMNITETFMVTNNGNATAKFKWQFNAESKIFVPQILEDTVEAGSSKALRVTYNPTPGPNTDEEVLALKVEDGNPISIKCTGQVTESRCFLVEKSLDFGNVPVGIRSPDLSIHIKNTIRTSAVFHVVCPSDDLQITPMKGKIAPDSKMALNVSFLSNGEKNIAQEITVNVRGGRSLKIPVKASAVIPKVRVDEEFFDFSGVTFGDSRTLPLTLVNESAIPAKLIFDLREYAEFELLMPSSTSVEDDLESEYMVVLTDEGKNITNLQDVDEEDLKEADEDDEEEEDHEEEERRYVQITVKPEKSPLRLQLKYTPCDVNDPRHFELPLSLAGVGSLESLARGVKAVGIQPRFLMDLTLFDFKKKVISKTAKPFPAYIDVTVSNPGHEPLIYALNKEVLEEHKVFQVNPYEGRLEPGTTSTIRATFSPTEAKEYSVKIPVYLDNDVSKPYLMLEFRGEGTHPKITFDRREIVMPVVPLGIQARATFTIENDGYENLELRPKIASEVGKLPVVINFPEGKNLGVTRQKVKVEAVFSHKKPLSFTTKLEFYDDDGNVFSIPIAGTTDNSLFTVYQFLQRNADEYALECPDGKPIMIVQDASSDVESSAKNFPGRALSKTGASSVISRTAKSLVGFNPIPQHCLERNAEYIMRWLNINILQNSIQNFPTDIINSNGAQIYELIQFLTGKQAPGRAKTSGSPSNKKDSLKALTTQYEELLNYLKTNGGLLNTVRPEYLLSLSDYSKFLKLNPRLFQYRSNRTLERVHAYISVESWITLFYQIIKIFYLGRVTPKNFKNLSGMTPTEATIDASMNGSNIYTVSESILLKWLQTHYAKVNPLHAKRLTNFDSDLQDGQVIATIIQSHYGNVKALSGMKPTCFNEEQLLVNAKKVIDAIQEIGLVTHLTPKDLVAPTARELALFVLQMYQSLPQYVPKAVVEFPAVLGDVVTKNIELTNPSGSAISYWVKLDGSSDFTIDSDNVRLEKGGDKINFPIKFTSRVSAPVTGKVIFTNKKEGSVQAAAMVFELKSDVHSRRSVEVWNITSKLYQQKSVDVTVQNPFKQDSIFNVELIYEKKKPPPSNRKLKRDASKPQKLDSAAPASTVPEPFYCKHESLRLTKGGSTIIPIVFLPFELGTHKCYIIFSDVTVGEIQHEIIATSELPPPIETIKEKCNAEEIVQLEIPLPFRNVMLEKAKTLVIDRSQGGYLQKGMTTNAQMKTKPSFVDGLTYEVEVSNPFYSGPSTITLHDNPKGGAGSVLKDNNASKMSKDTEGSHRGSVAKEDPNRLLLQFAPKSPAVYPCFLVLKSLDKTDIRVIEIISTAIPQTIKAQLEFVVPARGSVTQEIPIINNSDRDWNIKANLVQDKDKNGAFSLNVRDLSVKKKHSGSIILTFKPTWTCQMDAKFVLTNASTNEMYEYDLKGIGEEPLAEDHIVLNCRARETSKCFFDVKNPSDKAQIFRVETDLNNVVGAESIKVKGKETGKYEIQITPVLGGVYTGSITFFDSEDKFTWYTVEIRTESPKPEKTITIPCVVRKAAVAEISLENPLEEMITFDVFYTGEGLIGDTQFSIGAQEKLAYELVFSPLIPGDYNGVIGFLNERVGEFWYELELVAQEPPVIIMEQFECELGKFAKKFATLENPTSNELSLEYKCTNPTNFEVIPDKIVIPGFEEAKVCIQYSPSNLDSIENATIIFENSAVGKWEFYCEGKGLLPTLMENQPISTSVGNNTSSMLPFKNPFREAVAVNVEMETDDPSVFSLLLKRNKFNVMPLGILQIPYSFSPHSMTETKATIIVSINPTLIWKYPIKGIAESASIKTDFHFKCTSRDTLDENISLQLPGFEGESYNDTFSYEINVLNSSQQGYIDRSVILEQTKDTLNGPSDKLEFTLKFEPLRPFKSQCELLIYKSSGGRWKFNIIFEALEPEVDDIIQIQSPLNKTSSVSFKLTNHQRVPAEFAAFFTPDSASEFVVLPKSGSLEPYGKEGTTFIVSFTPVEYGKPKQGRLIIQTEEMQWSYEIRGSHPQYKIPEAKGGRVNNKLAKETIEFIKKKQVEKKNYLKENIRKSPKKGKRDN